MTGQNKVDLPSQPTPTRVLLARTDVECQIQGFAFPELSRGVHRRLQAQHDGFGQSWPLLAGPVRFEGSGRTWMGYCAPGDRFQFSLGLEEGLTVERQQAVKDDVVPITGTQRWTTKTEVSVHNLTGQTRSLTVRERVPISEISDINVKLLRTPKEHSFDAETGFVDCPLELGPYQSVRLSLVQRVKASPPGRVPNGSLDLDSGDRSANAGRQQSGRAEAEVTGTQSHRPADIGECSQCQAIDFSPTVVVNRVGHACFNKLGSAVERHRAFNQGTEGQAVRAALAAL